MSFFRNLFGRRTDTGKSNGTATLEPLRPTIRMPQERTAQPEQRPPPAPAEPASPEECISLPLKAITDLFPADWKISVLRKPPSEHVQVEIPRSLILPQLSGGSVRITYAQLRARTPEIFFHPNGAPPEANLTLPLDAVLRQMMPSRREDQRETYVPSNIPSVFAKAGAALQPRAAGSASEPWYSHRRPTYDGPGTEIPPEPALDESIPDEEVIVETAAPAAEAAPPPPPSILPSPDRVLTMPSVPAAETAPAPEAAPAPSILPTSSAPVIKAAPAASVLPSPDRVLAAPASILPTPPPPVSTAPAPVPAAEDHAAASEPAPEPAPVEAPHSAPVACVSAETVPVPLSMVLPGLPPEISQSFAGSDPETTCFLIPFEKFEAQMRSGKLRFKWSQLQAWCKPAPSAPVASHADIDLPLADLVPIFLSRRKSEETRKKIEIDSKIPDVFGKTAGMVPEPKPAHAAAVETPAAPTAAEPISPPPAPPTPVETAPPTPAPCDPIPFTAAPPVGPIGPIGPISQSSPAEPTISAPVPFPASASAAPAGAIRPLRVEPPPASKPQPSAPSAREAQILHRIRALDGVIGAFMATCDGLLIAADLPEANEKILAAFAPAVFSQLAKYSEMAELGLPEAVDLHLDAGNIHVRKAGKIFVGVLTPRGRMLPLADLNLISAALQPHAS